MIAHSNTQYYVTVNKISKTIRTITITITITWMKTGCDNMGSGPFNCCYWSIVQHSPLYRNHLDIRDICNGNGNQVIADRRIIIARLLLLVVVVVMVAMEKCIFAVRMVDEFRTCIRRAYIAWPNPNSTNRHFFPFCQCFIRIIWLAET